MCWSRNGVTRRDFRWCDVSMETADDSPDFAPVGGLTSFLDNLVGNDAEAGLVLLPGCDNIWDSKPCVPQHCCKVFRCAWVTREVTYSQHAVVGPKG